MGHFLFIVFHVFAALFSAWLLIFTIPLHLIYSAVSTRTPRAEKPAYVTHVRCPACAEYVLRAATKCKHCGEPLTPQPLPPQPSLWEQLAHPEQQPRKERDAAKPDRRYPPQ